MQSRISSLVLGLAGALAAVNPHEVLANAAPAVVEAQTKEAKVIALHQSHLGSLAEVTSSPHFREVLTWYQKICTKETEEGLIDLRSQLIKHPDDVGHIFIKSRYPAEMRPSKVKELAKFFTDPATSKVLEQLQELEAKKLENLQSLAKDFLETNSPKTKQAFIKALNEAGINLEKLSAGDAGYYALAAVLAVGVAAGIAVVKLRDTKSQITSDGKTMTKSGIRNVSTVSSNSSGSARLIRYVIDDEPSKPQPSSTTQDAATSLLDQMGVKRTSKGIRKRPKP